MKSDENLSDDQLRSNANPRHPGSLPQSISIESEKEPDYEAMRAAFKPGKPRKKQTIEKPSIVLDQVLDQPIDNIEIPEVEKLRKRLEESEDENTILIKQNRKLYAKVKNLEVDFSVMFYTNHNKRVTVKYAREIMVYLITRYAAVKEAKRRNKGVQKEYPIVYETNIGRLMKLFDITEYQAQKTIKFLTDTGAWRDPKIIVRPNTNRKQKVYEPGEPIPRGERVVSYKIGERKQKAQGYENPDGGYSRPYITTFCFNLYQHTTIRNFYKQAISNSVFNTN